MPVSVYVHAVCLHTCASVYALVHMCSCVCLEYVHVCICVCVISVYMCLCMSAHVGLCGYSCLCVCFCACVSMCSCAYVLVHAALCACPPVCVGVLLPVEQRNL
jgi:hypothetical protein